MTIYHGSKKPRKRSNGAQKYFWQYYYWLTFCLLQVFADDKWLDQDQQLELIDKILRSGLTAEEITSFMEENNFDEMDQDQQL